MPVFLQVLICVLCRGHLFILSLCFAASAAGDMVCSVNRCVNRVLAFSVLDLFCIGITCQHVDDCSVTVSVVKSRVSHSLLPAFAWLFSL